MNGNMDLKKIVMWLFGIMIISFLIAGSIMSVKGLGGTFISNSGSAKSERDINVEKTFNADDIKDMLLSTSSTNITIHPVDTNEVKVHYHGYMRSSVPRSAPELEVELRGGKLVVREKHKVNITIGFNFTNQSLKLDVYVPKSYAGNMDIGTSSGDVSLDDMTLDRFSFSSSSGNLRADSLKTTSSQLNTSSGDMRIRGFSGSLSFNSSSGSLTASDVDLTGNLKTNSSSGETRIDVVSVNGNINTNTSSGDVEIRLPENSEFSVDFDTSSGDFKTDFATTTNQKTRNSVRATVGSGGFTISSHSSSGNLEVMKR